MKFTCKCRIGKSSAGSAASSTPRIAKSPGGISTMTASARLTNVGLPHPSFAIGPIKKVPSLGGKKVSRSLMMRGALATTSVGNIRLLMALVRTPSAMASNTQSD
jgi:hypothetical protein